MEILGVDISVSFHRWDRSFDEGNGIEMLVSLSSTAIVPSHCRDELSDDLDINEVLTVV